MEKCVIVTGGARNTGLAIAERFAREGRAVVITGRTLPPVQEAAEGLKDQYGIKALALELDQGQPETVPAFFDAVAAEGLVADVLVCNAAHPGLAQPILTVPTDEWAAVIRSNVIGTFAVAREGARRMVDEGCEGSISIIASNQARRGVPERSAYGASKGALSAMCKVFAVELADKGIRTNCLMPGRVRTAVFDNFDEKMVEGILSRIPTGKLVEEDEVAEAVWYLASPAARNITGVDFIIDGGCDVQMFSS